MHPREILFLGGDPDRNASTRIRAVEIASKLGCDYRTGFHLARNIPGDYKACVCVKAQLWPGDLAELSRRCKIIWDVIDELPPRENVDIYLASSQFAAGLLESYGRVEVIPHRHRNFSGGPNPPNDRRAGWIGHAAWHARLPGLDYDKHFVDQMGAEEVTQAYRQTGIGLNFRRRIAEHDLHVALNSGIKLINCLGFGIPSVSAEEPAFREFGEECTIFSTAEDCAKHVHELQNDNGLYDALRQKCCERAHAFHIDAIAEQYRSLFATL